MRWSLYHPTWMALYLNNSGLAITGSLQEDSLQLLVVHPNRNIVDTKASCWHKDVLILQLLTLHTFNLHVFIDECYFLHSFNLYILIHECYFSSLLQSTRIHTRVLLSSLLQSIHIHTRVLLFFTPSIYTYSYTRVTFLRGKYDKIVFKLLE